VPCSGSLGLVGFFFSLFHSSYAVFSQTSSWRYTDPLSFISRLLLTGNHNEEQRKAAYLYGTYVGQAFQLIDDALDFEGTLSSTGKAPLADLQSGLATAPTLFAAEEFPKLAVLIGRKFESPGDVDEALELVNRSRGLQRCKQLAQVHAEKAIEAVQAIGVSVARDSLVALAAKVVTRTH